MNKGTLNHNCKWGKLRQMCLISVCRKKKLVTYIYIAFTFFNYEVENLYTKMFLVMKQNKTDYSSLFLPYFTADLLIMGIPWLSIIKIWNNSQYTKHHTLKNRWRHHNRTHKNRTTEGAINLKENFVKNMQYSLEYRTCFN